MFIPLLLILNIYYTVYLSIKYKQKRLFSNILISIISIFLLFNNIDEKIAINIELKRAKYRLNKIIKNEYYKTEGIKIENGLYAFTFYPDVVDNWIAIVYDNSGMLENGIITLEDKEKYMETETYKKLKNYLVGGYI